ncbi:MAG: transketolase [Desulfobacterales bacterium]
MQLRNLENRDALIDALNEKAEALRKEIIRLAAVAGGGHIGGGLSMAEIIVALHYYGMNLKENAPDWPNRDRFILSKGHGSIAYCPVLADLGFFPRKWLDSFNLLDSPFGMHPDMRKIPGVEMSTGSLGHGLSVGVGMAITARLDRADWRVFVLMGDGETHEGMVWEAAQAASHYKLGNLIALIDRNGLCLDGPTEEVMCIEPICDRWQSFGWNVYDIDGHDMDALVRTIDELPPHDSEKPTLVICRTTKGRGVAFMEGDPVWHYSGLDAEKTEEAIGSIESRRPERRCSS